MFSREKLLEKAREAAKNSYCRYSHFHVGAVVVAGERIYVGVNIELSSYDLTLCAERTALAAALSDNAGPITHIAVSCVDSLNDSSTNWLTPCGACRQWMVELAPNATIYIDGLSRDFTVSELMPHPFGPQDGRVNIRRFARSELAEPGIAFTEGID